MEITPDGNVVRFLKKEITKNRKIYVNSKYVSIYCIHHLSMENASNGNILWFLVKESKQKCKVHSYLVHLPPKYRKCTKWKYNLFFYEEN